MVAERHTPLLSARRSHRHTHTLLSHLRYLSRRTLAASTRSLTMLLALVALGAAAVSAFDCPTISDEIQTNLASVCIGDDAGLCGDKCFSAIVSAALGRQGLSLPRPLRMLPSTRVISFRFLLSSTPVVVSLLKACRRYLEYAHVKLPLGRVTRRSRGTALPSSPRPPITSTRVSPHLSSSCFVP